MRRISFSGRGGVNNRLRRLGPGALFVLVSALLALGVVAPGAASAAPATAQAACVYDIGLTIKQGTVIRGSASMSKCLAVSRIEIYLQRDRGLYWQTLDHKTRTSTGSTGVSWNCAGAGRYKYRTLVRAYRSNGSKSIPPYKISNQPTFTC